MLKLVLSVSLAGVGLLATSGCSKQSKNKPAVTAPQAQYVLTEADRASAMAFGEKWAEALLVEDRDFVSERFDLVAMAAIDFSQFDLSAKDRSDFQAGILEGLMSAKPRIIDQMVFAQAKPLRVTAGEQGPLLMMRFIPPAGGMDYQELHLAPMEATSSEWKIVDLNSFAAGRFSDNMRKLAARMVGAQNASVLEKLVQGEDALLKHMGQIQKSNTLRAQGRHQEAVDILSGLPDAALNQKMVLLGLIMNAMMLDGCDEVGSPYYLAIKRFEENFPDDPALDLMLIDSLLAEKRFSECRQRVKNIDERIGGDPYLRVVEGYIDIAEGKYAQAKKRAEKFRAIEPESPEGDSLLLEVGLGSQDFELVATVMKRMEKDFGWEWDLEGVSEFDEFLKSPEAKPWR